MPILKFPSVLADLFDGFSRATIPWEPERSDNGRACLPA